jgi:hypothetical protein
MRPFISRPFVRGVEREGGMSGSLDFVTAALGGRLGITTRSNVDL